MVQIPPPAPPEPRPGMPAPPPGQFENMLKARALTARQDFARLILGLLATSTEAYPLTFKYIGQAEAPQGKAHVLEGTGENNFKIKYFVHMETSLPVMVSWTAPARPAPPVRARGRGAGGRTCRARCTGTLPRLRSPRSRTSGARDRTPSDTPRTPSVRCRTLSARPRTPSVRCPHPQLRGKRQHPRRTVCISPTTATSMASSCPSACAVARHQHDRRNHLRPLSTQSENRST